MFKREEKILIDFFQRRKLAGLKYDYVIDALENNDERLKYLVDKEVLRENSDNYELDELYLSFFEQVLDANEEINTSYINENLETIRQNINYYVNERTETKRSEYLRKIKNTLRNIGSITLRNVIDLSRNVENTYKTEANYKNKMLKLQNFDKKCNDIKTLINQIQVQSAFIEKLNKIKYLKDQHTLRSSTDINSFGTYQQCRFGKQTQRCYKRFQILGRIGKKNN